MKITQISLKSNEKIAFTGDIHADTNTPESRIDDIGKACINKMKDILKKCVERNVKVIFFPGDIFNRVVVPHSCVNTLGEVLVKFKGAGIELFSICGNHDILRNSMDYLDRSPLQTLFSFGIIKHINLENRVLINNEIFITPCDYTEYPPKIDKLSTYNIKTNILLAHMFFNASKLIADEKHNLSTEDVIQLGYDIIFLGHDHEEYPIEEVGKSIIIRNGSLLRGTSHNYNFTRKPNIIVFNDLSNICKSTIEKVVIDHLPYKDVVSAYVLNKKQEGSISGLQDVLSNLASRLAMSTSDDGDRILEIIKTDPNLPTESRLQILEYVGEIS